MDNVLFDLVIQDEFMIRFTIPVMNSWIRAGNFQSWERFKAAWRENLIYWGILLSIGAIVLIYIVASGTLRSK